MSELAELIARLEKATGPDRELDDEIARLEGYRGHPLPHTDYTRSIDAALTLVPESWAIFEMGELSRLDDGSGWYATLMSREGRGEEHSSHKTPALALCIAALKARSVSAPSSRKQEDKGIMRIAIVFDGTSWFVRRIRTIDHDIELDEKVYRCDLPIGIAHATLDEAVSTAKNALDATAPHEPEQVTR